MEDESDNSTKTDKPWLFKKGQSGNPGERPPGKTLKQYTREMLAAMTDEERQKFLNGLSKDIVWQMAEGRPKQDTELAGKDGLPFVVQIINYDNNTGAVSIPTEELSTGLSSQPSEI